MFHNHYKKLSSYVFITLLLVIPITLTACKNNETSTSISNTPSGSSDMNTDNIKDETKNKKSNSDSPTTSNSLAKTIAKEDYPKVDGSTATIPLSEAIYQYFTGATIEEAQSAIVHTKTTNSYLSLIDGTCDIIFAYEPSSEVQEALKNTDVKLNMKPIGRDALVFLANENNPITSITNDQLIKIYSKEITNWSAIGDFEKDIVAFQRPDRSGSQTLMKKLVMKDIAFMDAPSIMRPTEMDDIIISLAQYNNESNAIGYSVYYYAQNMFTEPGLRYMAINDIMPNYDTIQDGTYPYINEFYAVIREDETTTSNAHKIFDWITGEDGQLLVKELDYVPIN